MKLKLATNIRTLRKERALTQEQLAAALGVTIGAVSKWESSTTTWKQGKKQIMHCYNGHKNC